MTDLPALAVLLLMFALGFAMATAIVAHIATSQFRKMRDNLADYIEANDEYEAALRADYEARITILLRRLGAWDR